MRPTGRLLAVLLAGIVLSTGGAVWLQRDDGPPAEASDNPLLVAAPQGSTTSSSTTTTIAHGQPGAPVAPPRDGYMPEPIQKIGTIEIPKIGLAHEVYHGISLLNIDKGPSHWPGTAFPGEDGNTVFAGHRVTHSRPFRRIHELAPGDEVIFTIAGVRSVYVVTESFVVTPKQLEIVNPTPTPMATLFACHPPGSARERYVVRAALVAEPPAA
jgi:sortase A